jgi:hypothetical protein
MVSSSASGSSSDDSDVCWPRLGGRCLLLIASVLCACATPAEHFERRSAALGFTSIGLEGDGFHHLAYVDGVQQGSGTLHVYVEHDGTPWTDLTHVASDPTPRVPFALELMARDVGPRLLLGRPCYFESRKDFGCGPLLWTQQRYSPEVVRSMVAALRSFLSTHPFRRVVLIGYSGGGTIAWLMAPHVAETTGVVTVAANLDTDDWTKIHGYSSLEGSLNPALLPELPPAIVQLHYVGGRDQNVPPSVVRSFARHHLEAHVIEIADFEHLCCWIEQWPQLLDRVGTSPLTTGRQLD